ncbi:MAG: type III pantothenate kinase [Anaerosomatales bacterium]|nr:type III pantothenate kinase [Anaerosomatales bacterium]GAV31698.1 pantothenic acid kinase [Coriobacteriaceae bacterium EMTCatB1]
MILGIDVGNTQTVLGLFDGDELDGHWRIATDASMTADELRVKVGGLLELEGVSFADVERVVLSSVVPALTDQYEVMAERATGTPPMVVGPGIKTGIPIRYDDPREVGADRIVNAVAAVEAYGVPVIVVDFGTATTFDVVDASGAYVGGAIAPGVETSADALFSRAARLAKVDLEAPSRVIGRNTTESVQAGLLLGEAAMVDGLVRRIQSELGASCRVVATGGLAARMAPLCETIDMVDPDLTLRGLLVLYRRNA